MLSRFICLAALLAATPAIADTTVAATSSAEVVKPLAMSQTQSMSFGSFSGPTSVFVPLGFIYGSIDTNGMAQNLPYASGGQRPGIFSVSALPSSAINITCPANFPLTSGSGSRLDVIVTCPTTLTTDGTGAAQLTVAGSILMFGGATAGSYSGSYDVTANY